MMKLVEEGVIPESRIDQSCRRILEMKFRLGLFENPFFEESAVDQVLFKRRTRTDFIGCCPQKYSATGKQRDPAPDRRRKIQKRICDRPNADSQGIMGDWTFPQPMKMW
jgi:beta-glucosidase